MQVWKLLCLLFLLVILFAASGAFAEQVTLRMGSWRTDGIEQMNSILKIIQQTHPEIKIIFDPTSAPEYDAVLQAQLEAVTAPDLFYLRSFGVSRSQYEQGFLEPLDGLSVLRDNFAPAMRAPWTSADGVLYGVPFIATSHGVYFNEDIFNALNLQPPSTWGDFLKHWERMKTSGILPLANASGDPWTINELIFFNLAPNFIGGRAGRMAYLSGKRCFNDGQMVAALQAVADLAPYLPVNHPSGFF